jgi:hypothetical protein
MLGRQDFLQRFKQELFFILFCLVPFSSVAALIFFDLVAELEVTATQTYFLLPGRRCSADRRIKSPVEASAPKIENFCKELRRGAIHLQRPFAFMQTLPQ